MLVHNVYFTLRDDSLKARQQMIDACHKYLKGHPGEVFFGAGQLEPELARPVNVRDFHVALHVIFDDRAAHDTYQTSERHTTFIEENKDNWEQVRVFDSITESASTPS